MSGEPKTLTPEQAKAQLARDKSHAVVRIAFHPHEDDGRCSVERAGSWGRVWFASADAALSAALGAPVVARDEAAELRAALRTLVADLEDLMEESHIELYDGDGYLVGVSWGKLLQGGKDEYLSNWRDAKRLAGGEEQE